MRESIFNRDWRKVRTVESSLIPVWLLSRTYVDTCWQELGVGFDNVILQVQKNLATTFRVDEEQQNFSQIVAQKLVTEGGFLQKIQITLTDGLAEFDRLFSLPAEDFLTIRNCEDFYRLHDTFYSYFLCMLWGPDAISNIKSSRAVKSEIYEVCEVLRKQTEPIAGKIEAFLQKVFRHIASKEKIDEHLLESLLPNELLTYIKTDKLPTTKTLRARREFCVIVASQDSNEVAYAEKAKDIIDRLTRTDSTVRVIKGEVANKGIAKGRAKLILTEKNGIKLTAGDVLITTMTRPEWVSFMKKASAYVTEIGGVLCHAAIVAREINIPCITGTKIATQVIKDGDLVEVDANAGKVTILEKA